MLIVHLLLLTLIPSSFGFAFSVKKTSQSAGASANASGGAGARSVAGALAGECQTRLRGIIDVGSGTTKLNLSEVEICPDGTRLLRVLDDQTNVDVPLESSKDVNGNVSDKAIQQLVNALKAIKEKAVVEVKEQAPYAREIAFAAVGTHAFRTARNIAEIAHQTAIAGVPIVAITQREEAEAGFEGVRAKGVPICAGRRLLVWDVGGGSMEWSLTEPRSHKFSFTGFPLGAESFRAKLVAKLHLERHPKCAVKSASPNPIGKANEAGALALAEQEAEALPRALKDLAPEKICLVGIGGVHTKAVEARIAKNWESIRPCVCGKTNACRHTPHSYTRRELECLADFFAEKSDCDAEIQGPYSTTGASNLFLISGFLRELNLNEVHTENVNMGHGLALDRKHFLKFQNQPIKH